MEKKTKEQLDRELLAVVHDLKPNQEIKIRKDHGGKPKQIVVDARQVTILEYEE